MIEFIVEIGKIAISYIAKLFFLPFHVFKIKQKRIMFTSLIAKKNTAYSGNPKYVFEYLRGINNKTYEIIWAFENPNNYLFLQQKNVRLVKHFSLKAFFYLMTAKVIVTNGTNILWIPFRKEQIIINTWHGGGAYKQLITGTGYMRKIEEKRYNIAGQNTTLFLSSSRAFSDNVIRGVFHFHGPILDVGMPRNDILLLQHSHYNIIEKVQTHYELNKQVNILLYAPTYRDTGNYTPLNLSRIVHFLMEMTGKDWVCLVRFHYLGNEKKESYQNQIINAGDYPDMQELLVAANLLITDYSSSIWDYSLLEKPCYLYVPDLKIYQETRGFDTDIHDWCMPYAEDEDTLFKLLAQMDNIDWHKNAQKHHSNLGSYETGHATEAIGWYIENVCNS